MRIGWILFIALVYNSCGESSTNKKNPAPVTKASLVSALTMNDILVLANEADFVDILFYHLNISVSQNDPPSVRQSVNFLTDTAKPMEMQCPSIGRITYLSKGKILKEADIHMGVDCHYFTIIDNKVAAGTVAMSPDGVRFFQALLDSYKSQ